MKAIILVLGLLSGHLLADTKTVLELDKHVSAIPEAGFQYKGQSKLSKEESELLMADAERKKAQAKDEKDCKCSADSSKAAPEPHKKNPKKDDWQVVFLMRLSVKSDNSTNSTSHSPVALGTARAISDRSILIAAARSGTLTNEMLNKTLAASGDFLKKDPKAAMAYVAALGDRLNENYGDSHAGKFVTAFEQYGRMAQGASVGQCSDIHYAMLRAYKQLTGNANAKAYLVNFQTGKSLHHTNLVIEEGGQIYVVNYGEITSVPATRAEALRQNSSAGHGIAYRVFGEDKEYTDKMLAHIDSPMGMFLREVSTGQASYNPLQTANYSLGEVGLAKSGAGHVKIFFGELGGGDVLTGVALNLKGAKKLPAGFTLESHLSGAIAYAHKKFQTDTKSSSLHSQVLYINTGLGLVSPKLELGNFSVQARTDLALEGGVWFKQYSDGVEREKNNMEGDGNIVSRSKVTATYETNKVTVKGTAEVEVMPSFATAFPKATDGSTPEGLTETLGILPNRVTGTFDVLYHTNRGISLGFGTTYSHTPLGGIGEVRSSVSGQNWAVQSYLRGALDRDRTPAFVPGAPRTAGIKLDFCTETKKKKVPLCLTTEAQKSLEDSSWQLQTTFGGRF